MIVFSSAHAGVLYDYHHDTMQLVQGHQNMITSIGTDGQGRWIVTAAEGKDSVLVIWDVVKLLPIRTLFDPHPDYGVAVAALSPDGRYLVTIGNDPEQQCQFWLWTFNHEKPDGVESLTDAGKSTKCICFNNDNTRFFMITQERGIVFGTWEHDPDPVLESTSKVSFASIASGGSQNENAQLEYGRILKTFRPTGFWKAKHGNIQESCYVDNTRWALSCTSQGYVYVFSDDILENSLEFSNHKNCIKIIRLQNCGINTICCVDDVIATGNELGHIRFYDKYLRILYWCQKFELDAIVNMRFNLQPRKYVIKDPTDFSEIEGWNIKKSTCCNDPNCCKNRTGGLCTEQDEEEDRSDIIYDTLVPTDATISKQPFIVRDFVVATRNGRIGLVDFIQDKLTFILYGTQDEVTALELHPENYLLLVGNKLGHIFMYKYPARELQYEVDLPIITNTKAITYLKYSNSGTTLVCGLENGFIWFLHPLLLNTLKEKPETQLHHYITEICFSKDDKFLAISDTSFIIAVFKYDITDANGYKFFGTFRSHYGSIVKILFGAPRLNTKQPRLLTVGQDRMLIEYNLEGDVLALKSGERIEQSAIPTAVSWYVNDDDNLLITYEDQCKYKIINDGTGMTMGTYLGPTYGSTVRTIKMLPRAETLTDVSKKDYKHFVFTTDKHIGLQTLPPDGNPYKSIGMVGHPIKLTQTRISDDGLHLFTIGQQDSSVLMWQINPRSAELMSKLGGSGLEPYLTLLEGGEDGWIYREMQDMFYYSQILYQGENTDEPRKVNHIIPVTELADLLRGVGVYPSEYEVENLMTEVTYQNRLANKMGDECGENDVTFEQFVKLYINHRSVNGIPLEKIREAFEIMCKDSEEYATISKGEFLEALCFKGEAPGTELIKHYLMQLTGTTPSKPAKEPSMEEAASPEESSEASENVYYADQVRSSPNKAWDKQFKGFGFIPDVITCDHFIEEILGIETNPDKIKSFVEAIGSRQYSEPVLVEDMDDDDESEITETLQGSVKSKKD